jgi:membrane protein DedA with SNARE-associated domain
LSKRGALDYVYKKRDETASEIVNAVASHKKPKIFLFPLNYFTVSMFLETIILSVGYPLVFLLIMGESMGVPMPGETAVLIAAGAAGAGKGFNVWLVFLCSAAGAVAGGMIGYWIGKRGGRKIFLQLTRRRWLKQSHLEKAEKFFAKHGGKAVFFGRSVSYLRVLTALMAGVSHMPYLRFLFYNTFSGIVWAGVVSYIGYKFGQHLDLIERLIKEFGRGFLVAAILLGILYYIAGRFGWTKALSARFSKSKNTQH